MDFPIVLFEFIVLIFSAVLHEVAHGYMAERLGDPTARNAGRLTLNPIKHLDLFGSILMPLGLYIISGGAFFFAAAKPVPYDPRNLRNPRSGAAKIALAGPATNLLLALIFGIVIRVLIAVPVFAAGAALAVPDVFFALLAIIVYLNIALMIFNLIPIPPLDGSRVLFALLPQTQAIARAAYALERYGLIIVLFFAFFGFEYLIPVMRALFALFTGQVAPF